LNCKKLRRIFDSQKSLIIVCDKDGIIEVNRSFLEFFGCGSLEKFKERYRDLSELFKKVERYGYIYDFEDKNWIDFILENPSKTHKVKMNEVISGQEKIFAIEIEPDIQDDFFIISLTDITDLENYRQKLEFSNRLVREYQKVVEASSIVSKTDKNGIITYVNDKFVEISGYDREELIGKTHSVVGHPDMDRSVYQDIWRVIGSGRIWHGTIVNRAKSGKSYIVESTIAPITGPDDEVLEYVGIQEDITELVEAKERAEKAESAKTLFLANMSHEIRTPLNAILGYTRLLLRKDGLSDDVREMVDTINESGRSLMAIVNDILDISKFEKGIVTISEEPFSIVNMLKHLIDLFDARAKEVGVELRLEISGNIPEGIVSDEYRLSQVLSNLLGNAIKFTPEGGKVTLQAFLRDCTGDRCRIFFAVKDTGIGIDEETKSKIFQPFEQANYSTEKNFGGTGLGLAISSKIIGALGGKIDLESKPGEGSCFCFTIECEIADLDGRKEDEEDEDYLGDRFSGRILLVEDHPVNRSLIEAILAEQGLGRESIVVAVNGKEGVEKFKEGDFDLVLMDIEMPVMNGKDALLKILEYEKENGLEHTPIVALTAHASSEFRTNSLKLGFDDYLVKPIEDRPLNQVLSKYLEKSAMTLDISKISQSLNLPEDVFEEIVSLFFEAVVEDIVALEKAIESADISQIIYDGHKIKGSALAVRLDNVAEVAAKIEQDGKEGIDDMQHYRSLLEEMKRRIEENEKMFRNEISKKGKKA
jgi:PAS domain S-box-containing protein